MPDSIIKIVFGESLATYMEWVKIAVPAVIIVGLFFLGLYYERRGRRKKEEEILNRLRKMFHKDIVENYRILKEIKAMMIGDLLNALTRLSFLVYEKYLDRVCELKEEDMKIIYDTYSAIQWAMRIGKQDGEMYGGSSELLNEKIENHVKQNYEVVLAALEKGVRYFEGE